MSYTFDGSKVIKMGDSINLDGIKTILKKQRAAFTYDSTSAQIVYLANGDNYIKETFAKYANQHDPSNHIENFWFDEYQSKIQDNNIKITTVQDKVTQEEGSSNPNQIVLNQLNGEINTLEQENDRLTSTRDQYEALHSWLTNIRTGNTEGDTRPVFDKNAMVIKLMKEQYVILRRYAYPPMTLYLDAVAKDDTVQLEQYIHACLAIKTYYPKT